jgi:hypothetical protein
MTWHDNADADVRVVRVCDRETMACRSLFPIAQSLLPVLALFLA